MIDRSVAPTVFVVLASLGACAMDQTGWQDLERDLRARISLEPDSTEVAVGLVSLTGSQAIWIDADTRMHAASTMKVPVLIQLARQVDAGAVSWDDSVVLRNEFRSIVDGSAYQLTIDDDSDSTLYQRIGDVITYRELAERMIVRSSNLATNVLVDVLGATATQHTARELGADSIEVLRGVEDLKAYRQGLSNTTTARDLAVLMRALATGHAASGQATEVMVEILEGQEFHDLIPAGLPEGTRVANKTGWITGIVHDAAIVYPTSCPAYVLVVLTRGFGEYRDAAGVIAELSSTVYHGLACSVE
jgi:beta-lactamase class A